jgi:hypothetical protein
MTELPESINNILEKDFATTLLSDGKQMSQD